MPRPGCGSGEPRTFHRAAGFAAVAVGAAALASASRSGRAGHAGLQSRSRFVAQRSLAGAAAVGTCAEVDGLKPELLWQRFAELSSIPRPSYHEAAVLDWIKGLATERELEWKQDKAGNLVVYRPGSGGGEDAPPICIQGHVDMVTEKSAGSKHDFLKDPIRLQRRGEWLAAQDTTLGSDNGIGVAAGLALLDSPPEEALPPLELLFTVAEEVGLVGAFDLDSELIAARTMLNLDTEEWPKVYFGCAGGGTTQIQLPVRRAPAPSACDAAVEIVVGGLRGGHSGLNIGEGRGNAVLCCARVANAALAAAGPEARLASIEGGDKPNAIPRDTQALLLCPESAREAAIAAAETEAAVLREEYGILEELLTVKVSCSAAASGGEALDDESARRLFQLLDLLPSGALKVSHAVPGMVETSSNVAKVAASEDGSAMEVVCSSRSSIGGALEDVRRRIRSLCTLVGAECEQPPAYPGWAPDPSSEVLGLVREELAQLGVAESPEAVEVTAIHAGLECGILKAKCPGMDVVSFGPTIMGAHSPDEAIEIASVAPFWELTRGVLRRLAAKRR